MSLVESSFKSSDETNLYYKSWLIEDAVGTVILFHGMAEHSGRYNEFALFLNKSGYSVYALDFRGHGKNSGHLMGHFAENSGWHMVVNDMKSFVDYVINQEKKNNVILFGHSMGSLLLRSYLIKFYDKRIRKVVLSGTPAAPSTALLIAARTISQMTIAFGGAKKPSAFMDKLVFGQYSKGIKKPDTPFDWLSRDKVVVQKYIADPLCGFICTGSFFGDLFYGLKYCNNRRNIAKIDPKKKVLILSGRDDPAGNFGKGPQELGNIFSRVLEKGNSTVKIYDGYRHEILNELENMKVYEDVVEFLKC